MSDQETTHEEKKFTNPHLHAHWWVRTEEGTFGPIAFTTLQRWAAIGSVVADTPVAEMADGPWWDADTLSELELNWGVITAEGDMLTPCHILALREEVAQGNFDPDAEVEYVPTGQHFNIVDTLCSALVEQNRILESTIAHLLEEIAILKAGQNAVTNAPPA